MRRQLLMGERLMHGRQGPPNAETDVLDLQHAAERRRRARMKCSAPEELSAYADGEVAFSAKQQISAHLAGCGHCRDALGEIADVRDLLASLPAPAAPTGLAESIGGAVRFREARKQRYRPLKPVGTGALAGTAAAVLIVAGLWFMGMVNLGGGDDRIATNQTVEALVTEHLSYSLVEEGAPGLDLYEWAVVAGGN